MKDNFNRAFYLEKEIGQTPLELLNIYRENNPKYSGVKMAYAGRLDPLACGKMLVLSGEFCKERSKYLGLDKEYEFEVLLNFSSDSGDVLGMVDFVPGSNFVGIDFKRNLKSLIGKFDMKYPVFSSKTVKGKQLFLWALEGRLNEIDIPVKEIEVYSLDFISLRKLSSKMLLKKVFKKINSIKKVEEKSKKLGADFRRDKIRPRWESIFSNFDENDEFLTLKFKAKVSSGTYVRVLSDMIAQKLGSRGLAFSIKRTRMGKFKKFFGFGFFKDLRV